MADTPTNGETVAPVAPSNVPSTPAAPTQVTTGNADVEAAKQEAQNAVLRARQLENELAKFREEREAAERKQLEDKEEYKKLYEQTQNRLTEIESEKAAQERSTTLNNATQDIFKGYPENVVEIAKTAGISLLDDSESARNDLTARLDSIKEKVGGAPAPVSSNPNISAPAETGAQGGLGRPKTVGFDNGEVQFTDTNPAKVAEYLKGNPAIQAMKRSAGLVTE